MDAADEAAALPRWAPWSRRRCSPDRVEQRAGVSKRAARGSRVEQRAVASKCAEPCRFRTGSASNGPPRGATRTRFRGHAEETMTPTPTPTTTTTTTAMVRML